MKPIASSDIRNSAIRLTTGAQGILLIAACSVFIYQFILLPQFPEGGILGSKASCCALCVIPSLLLLTVTFLNERWSPLIGLVLSLLAVMGFAVFDEPFAFLGKSGIILWGFSIACLSVATFSTRSHAAETLKTLVAPLRHPLIKIALIVGGAMACLQVMAVLFMGAVLSGLGDQNPDGYAPDTTYSERRAWGQREMRQYFDHADQWVRKSELIAGDIGKVNGVAPIGWPNKVVTFFTDGPSVTMNLQVIGERGEGVLNLPEVQLPGYVKKDIKVPFGIHEESSWNFQGNSTLITSSGKSWFHQVGFDEPYRRILSEATAGNHQRVIAECQAFEKVLPKSYGSENRRRWGPELHCGMFLGLPPRDRRSLLLLLGDSQAAIGNVEDACDCYFDAAVISLHALDTSYWARGNWSIDGIDPAVPTRELNNANEALKKAHQLAPENETLKKLARERALAAYKHRNGHLFGSTWDMSDDQLRERSLADLRDLHIIAVKLAKESPWLQQELGRMKIRPEKFSRSQMKINKSDRYQARVTVEIAGSSGMSGKFTLNVFETPELSRPIDLYASDPRYPGRNYRGNSLTWRPENGKQVRLDGKTLKPRKRKKKKTRKSTK